MILINDYRITQYEIQTTPITWIIYCRLTPHIRVAPHDNAVKFICIINLYVGIYSLLNHDAINKASSLN